MRGNKSSVNLIGQLFVEVHSQKQNRIISFSQSEFQLSDKAALRAGSAWSCFCPLFLEMSLARIIDTLVHVCTRRRVRLISADGALWPAEEITAGEGRD